MLHIGYLESYAIKGVLLKMMIHLDMENSADAADMSMEINSSGNHPNILLQILFCFTKLRENMHFK